MDFEKPDVDVTHVVAKCYENTDWTKDLHAVIVEKDVDMPNVGREPASYFYYIIANYNALKGDYCFLQGHPFDHITLDDLKNTRYPGVSYVCNGNGAPDHSGLPVDAIVESLGLPVSEKYLFKRGCQFRVSAEKIRERPIEFYLKCFAMACMDERFPYVFERIVPLIFDLH